MSECTFIIFGASGDLATRKIIPALYAMVQRETLKKFLIIGAAFDATSMDAIIERSRSFIANADDAVLNVLKSHAVYQRLDFSKQEDFDALARLIDAQEKKFGMQGNRMIYCAASSEFFCTITTNCAQAGIARRCEKNERIWHRLVYEKPFGKDLASAREINACIARYFDEKQIYRIDHFLTKELVGNIALVRFTNLVFEPLWNFRYIDYVQVLVNESIGIENRGAYYYKYGALKDIVQNHILEMVALIGMESPEWLSGDYIRTERVKILEKIKVNDVMFGQYEGYTQEKNVHPQSATETFVAASLSIDNHRWSGVPFYIKTGKYLESKQTIIKIKFKQVDCLLAKHCPSESNMLTIKITPDAGFSLRLNVKKPGVADEVIPANMEFCHSCIFTEQTPEAYQVIFQEIIKGDQAIAVRFDEIEAAWKIIDTINGMDKPLYRYKKGSQGPVELEHFERKHGMRWQV